MQGKHLPQPETMTFIPGGRTLTTDFLGWCIGRFTDLNLKISADGLTIGRLFRKPLEVSWSDLYGFSLIRAMPTSRYDNFVQCAGNIVTVSLANYVHVPAEPLDTILSLYKLSHLIRQVNTSDEDIIESAISLTRKSNSHCLVRSFHTWSLWGLVGLYRPDLLPECITSQSVDSLVRLVVEVQSKEKTFGVLEALDDLQVPCSLARAALEWMSQNWKMYNRAIERAMSLNRAEETAKRGKYGIDGYGVNHTDGHAMIRGRVIELDDLLDASETLQSAQLAAGISTEDVSVFYYRGSPNIAQGLIWYGSNDKLLWFWMDKSCLKTNGRRNWDLNEILNAPLSGVEFHDQHNHISRWKPHECQVSERFPGK